MNGKYRYYAYDPGFGFVMLARLGGPTGVAADKWLGDKGWVNDNKLVDIEWDAATNYKEITEQEALEIIAQKEGAKK